MFTGIIEQIGKIQQIEGNHFTISHEFEEEFNIGDSIALNGMCATVLEERREKGERSFVVEIIEESRKLTTFGDAAVGDLVNLERAAVIGGRNSGHNVTGHIDQTGNILALEREGDYWLIRVEVNPKNRKLIVYKGSIAMEGISLTVSEVGDYWFEVSIISHTWEVTNLHSKKVGDLVNLEFDIYGKYVLNAVDE